MSERRQHRRYDLYAQVQVTRESEVHILSMLNISQGGIFLSANPKALPELTHGVSLELMIFDAEHEDLAFSAEGKVVRIVPATLPGQSPGFGVKFVNLPAENQAKLKELLTALRAQS